MKVYSWNISKILAKINIDEHILPIFLINVIHILAKTIIYDKVRDSSHVWLPKGWKNENGQNIKQNMFSRLKFSVDFIAEVKNT